jgi:hypothetical protein
MWHSSNIWERQNKYKFGQGEIKRILNSGNACYQSVQSLWSSRLLSKKIRIYTTLILHVVLYGCDQFNEDEMSRACSANGR